ncbi:MAG: sn-glycerol-3-phosphate ABC transporter ATP-binding protein UgpC [Planctomycetes bacterium]|nr:sn-glycerol-3-phosphate ABC transporter ATP-binding protein UgpC [Planctomycetota bacterium]
MAEVLLHNITKIYPGDVKAVDRINLHVRDRELIVLVGPSGCGKSTTLRMIAGLEEISGGTITIGNRRVNDVPPKDRDIAMVFQNYALYPHMTVYNNMGFGLKLRKFKRAEIKRRVHAAAEILGITELLDRRPKALSGGQRQRVAMGRAIVREPAAFLFDEPLSNLDAKMRVEMRKEIIRQHKKVKTTMIYVTHDQVEAMTLGDRVVVMRDGIIEQVAEPLTVYNYPETLFVARFIGTPPMNIFPGMLEPDGNGFFFNGGECIRALLPEEMHDAISSCAGKKVYLGIRPKAFELIEDASNSKNSTAWPAKVELTETLGDEVLVHVASDEHRYQVSLDPHTRPDLDRELLLKPLLSRAHIFDGETEKNLTMPVAVKST